MPWVLILLALAILFLAALSDNGEGGPLFAIVLVGLYFLPFGLVVALAMPVNHLPKKGVVVTKILTSVEVSPRPEGFSEGVSPSPAPAKAP